MRTTANVPASWNTALDSAIADWTGIPNCNIRFYRTTSTLANITISHNATTGTYVARASFPDSSGNPGTTPTRFLLNFSNCSLLYIPASKLVRLYASNYLISYGNDWSKCNIGGSLFHIKQNVWSTFYWKISATTPYLKRIRNGVFCNSAISGTAQTLSPGIRVIW